MSATELTLSERTMLPQPHTGVSALPQLRHWRLCPQNSQTPIHRRSLLLNTPGVTLLKTSQHTSVGKTA